ncbi:hypothetical protein CSX11_17985 [Mycobacterium goodii]|nr:hypothetical protein CSX11_17985 [Mycolicibacterium goodii]
MRADGSHPPAQPTHAARHLPTMTMTRRSRPAAHADDAPVSPQHKRDRPAARAPPITRARIVRRHVARARADHERSVSRRNRVFPTAAVRARRFDAHAARREGRALTKGYRRQVRAVRKFKTAKRRR